MATAAICIASWRLSAPTTRYAPAPRMTRPAAQPRTDAPRRTMPLGVGPLHARASSWSRCWVRIVRSRPGSMMLSIIWMLVPTHWTKFVCWTQSLRVARFIRYGSRAAASAGAGATPAASTSASAMPRATPSARASARGGAEAAEAGTVDGTHRLPEDTTTRQTGFSDGLVGEVRRQPPLGLLDRHPRAARVVGQLVRAHPPDPEVVRPRGARSRARTRTPPGSIAIDSVSLMPALPVARRAARTASPSRCGRAWPDSRARAGCPGSARAMSVVVARAPRRARSPTARGARARAAARRTPRPAGRRAPWPGSRVVVVRRLEARRTSSSTPCPAVTANAPT